MTKKDEKKNKDNAYKLKVFISDGKRWYTFYDPTIISVEEDRQIKFSRIRSPKGEAAE